jgi:ABC-type sugar transport system ATPase subunit
VGVPVLRDVEIELTAGSVHGLVGENGSGKSTLIKLLTGVLKPQLGSPYVDDSEISMASPAEAQDRGIAVVHQDYNLFPDLSVAQNVLGVGGSLPRRWLGTVDKAKIEREVDRMLQSLGIDLAPDALVRSLGPAERKFVEIVRAMRLHPRFLILDEPTASLEPHGSKSVIELLKRLREQGVGLCFASHRLNEVLDIADKITVLRDGRRIGCVEAGEVTQEKLVEMIVGRHEERRRETVAMQHAKSSDAGSKVLSVRGVALQAGRPPVNFDIERGEILGMTGLLGSGAGTIVRMLGGAEALRGYVEVDGKRVRIRDPRGAERLGIGFIPEDRKASGAIPELSVALNISLASMSEVTRAGVLDYWKMRERGQAQAERLDVRASSVDALANTLSGGNLQKVLLAKWLATESRVLAVEEPTHGIDIGAKVQVHALLRKFVEAGGSIVVSMSEVEEVLELCDRIAVFRHGALVKLVRSDELTHSELTVMGATDRLEEMIEGTESPRST